MTVKTQPFTFERAFDREGKAGPGQRPAQRKLLSLEEIEQLKRDAHAAGLRAAEQGLAKKSVDALQLIAKKIGELGDALDAQLAPAHADAAQLAYVTALKLTKVLLSERPEAEIRALIAQCIAEQAAEPHLVLRVNDMLHDPLKETVQQLTAARGFAGRIHVIGEPQIPAGDCHIEWADGGLERNLQGALDEIEATIRNYVLRIGGDDTPVPAPAAIMADPAPAPEPRPEPSAEPAQELTVETQMSIEGL
jgi:flagellar assembly protein FliH